MVAALGQRVRNIKPQPVRRAARGAATN